jgi:hypothetical protein
MEPTPDRALEIALEAERRGLKQVTITSAIGWKYSVAELAVVTRPSAAYFSAN